MHNLLITACRLRLSARPVSCPFTCRLRVQNCTSLAAAVAFLQGPDGREDMRTQPTTLVPP